MSEEAIQKALTPLNLFDEEVFCRAPSNPPFKLKVGNKKTLPTISRALFRFAKL